MVDFYLTFHQYWCHFTHYYAKMLHGDGQLLNRSRFNNLIIIVNSIIHFNPDLPIVLACDASSYSVVAVLAHKMHDDFETPIGFALHTLSQTENRLLSN